MTMDNGRNKKLRAYLYKLLDKLENHDIERAKTTQTGNRIILDITFGD